MLLKVTVSVTVSFSGCKSESRNLCSVIDISCVADLRILAYISYENDLVYHNYL